MNILIVDDELLLVKNLASILTNSQLEIEQIFQAKNVEEAIRLIRKENPDIILSDIRMPVKTGIDLASYVHEHYPYKPVILITGYSDFKYTQASIQFQVFDYILKPVDPDGVIASVKNAYQKLKAYEQHERLYGVFREYFDRNIDVIRKQYIENLLFHRVSDSILDAQKNLFHFEFTKYRLLAIRCEPLLKTNSLESEYYCTGLVEQYIQNKYPKALTYLFGNIVFFIWEVLNEDHFKDNAMLTSIMSDCSHYAKQNFFGELTVGISQISDSLSHIHHLRKQASECLDYTQNSNKGNILFYEDIISTAEIHYDIEDDLQELISAVRSGNEQSARNCFETIVNEGTKNSEEYLHNCFFLIISNLAFLAHELKIEDSQLFSIDNTIAPLLHDYDIKRSVAFLSQWIQLICETVSGEFQHQSNLIIESVKDFIQQNYSQNIGLTDAAHSVGRNSSYISRLVREFTGKSFTQLLTDKRIYEAKQLLKNTVLKINEVAEKTGYPNAHYFNRVFKANVTMSANDYRKFITTFEG